MNILMLTVALLSYSVSEEGQVVHIEGQILDINQEHLLMVVGTETLRLELHREVLVVLDGMPSSLVNLRPGFAARVEARRIDQMLITRKIAAESAVLASSQSGQFAQHGYPNLPIHWAKLPKRGEAAIGRLATRQIDTRPTSGIKSD